MTQYCGRDRRESCFNHGRNHQPHRRGRQACRYPHERDYSDRHTFSAPTFAPPYLLEPDRSNLVLAATLGLHAAASAPCACPINEGLTGLVAEQVLPVAVEDVHGQTSTFLVFQGVWRRGISLLSRCPADRPRHPAGGPRGADKRTKEVPRKRYSHLGRSGQPGRPRGQRGAHSRSFHCPHAGAPLVRRPQPLLVLGLRLHQPLSRPQSHPLVAAQPKPHRPAQRNPVGRPGTTRHRTGSAQPHQLRLPPPAGVSKGRPHLGFDERRRPPAPPRGLLFC